MGVFAPYLSLLTSDYVVFFLSGFAVAVLAVAGTGYLHRKFYRRNLSPSIYPLYDTLLVFGDSITQFGSSPGISGFVSHLSGFYSRRMDVLNRGFSGYNTRDALRIVSHVFPRTNNMSLSAKWAWRDFTIPDAPKPLQLCIIFFGANDARFAPYTQHVPLNEFSINLRKLVSLLRNPESEYYSPSTRILFVTPPAIGDKMVEEISRRDGHAPDRKNKVTRLYADAVKETGKDLGIPVVDIWTAIEDAVHGIRNPTLSSQDQQESTGNEADAVSPYEGYEQYLLDGLHLNARGNELLHKLLVAKITSVWPEMDPSAI
ncbi:isoamyl acetate-hydrolyzing esterase [Coemansia sp. RSA 989]|nr:isoamyl acetate-hydrolyzing esterase [Coemansia sp. RSA 1086]KAJ1753621.1 isoamyl acetate-hydrolyzing esterase [Coemansia sp. RSA 1821]KAJ1868558.1 isoamyl acetate-hydrolyzing esterase [Coemansia sp. RSA 989]KAJ1876168.1 isoamyl acetate-hydrolyzing esterase [Coemansia sp. RSA 990]